MFFQRLNYFVFFVLCFVVLCTCTVVIVAEGGNTVDIDDEGDSGRVDCPDLKDDWRCDQCKPGFEPDDYGTCVECIQGYFKEDYGPSKCRKCTDITSAWSHTTTKKTGTKSGDECVCQKGYYDQLGHDFCAECPIGKYSDTVGAVDDCTPCPWQTLAPAGSVSEEDCNNCTINSYPKKDYGLYPTADLPDEWKKCLTIENSRYKSCDSSVTYQTDPNYPTNQHGTVLSRGFDRYECEDPEYFGVPGNSDVTKEVTNVCGRDQSHGWANDANHDRNDIYCTCKPGMFYRRTSCNLLHIYYCLNPLTEIIIDEECGITSLPVPRSCDYGYTTLTMDGRFHPLENDRGDSEVSLTAEPYVFDEYHTTNRIYYRHNYVESDPTTWMKYTGAVEAEYNSVHGGCGRDRVYQNQHACGMQPTRLKIEDKETHCFPCFPGTYQETGRGEKGYGFCLKCPKNTYKNESGGHNHNIDNMCKNRSSDCHTVKGEETYNGATWEEYNPRGHCMKTFHGRDTDETTWTLIYEAKAWKLRQSGNERASIQIDGKIAEDINDIDGSNYEINIQISGSPLTNLIHPDEEPSNEEYCTKEEDDEKYKICDFKKIGCGIGNADVSLKCVSWGKSSFTFSEILDCPGGWEKTDTKMTIDITHPDSCTLDILFDGKKEFNIEDKIINGKYVWESNRDRGGKFQLVKSSVKDADQGYELWLVDGNENEKYPETTNWLQQYRIGPKWLGSVDLGQKKLKNVPGCPEEQSMPFIWNSDDKKCKRRIYEN